MNSESVGSRTPDADFSHCWKPEKRFELPLTFAAVGLF